MTKVFTDTCILYGALLRYISQGGQLSPESFLLLNTKNGAYQLYASIYVLEELVRVTSIRGISKMDIIGFMKYINCTVYDIEYIDTTDYHRYTNDTYDVHIIYGCTTSKCDILRTKNLKDFNCELIYQDFGISVQNQL